MVTDTFCYTSRWVEAFPTSERKACTVARILINKVICRHGAPKEILSDQGKKFLSKLINEICDYLATKKINTTNYHPQSNGLTFCEAFWKLMSYVVSIL